MSQGSTVYMVMYNYDACNYNMIASFSSKQDAYRYICNREKHFKEFELVEFKYGGELKRIPETDVCNICCLKPGGIYTNVNLTRYDHISSHVIVPISVN
jgi:hypothetical protein